MKILIGSKLNEYFLDSWALHNLLALDWCNKNGLEIENSETFGVQLANRLEVPAVDKIHCFVDLGPMKTAIIFYILDCNVPCVLGILKLENPTIYWVNYSVIVSQYWDNPY